MTRRSTVIAGIAGIVALVVGLLVGFVWGNSGESGTSGEPGAVWVVFPTDTSADAGFSRDMSTHHSQAVDMADRIRDRTDDPALHQLATDIVLTQQSQIGIFLGWLQQWDLPATSSGPPMAWASGSDHGSMTDMDMSGMDMSGMDMSGSMPGMATSADVAELSTLPIDEAEVQFLRLMIAHHLGGVEMAETVLPLTSRDDVTRMAQGIIRSQQSDITAMNEMLEARGQQPVTP